MFSLSLPSPLGPVTFSSDGSAITGVYFGKKERNESEVETQNFASLRLQKQCTKELQEYFSGKRTIFSVPIAPEGTEFQKKVWKEISRVPFGETITYKELAKRAGKPKAIRAAASACGKNQIVILIPCHRILASDGGLGGYSGGLQKKKLLLALEKDAR